MENKQRNISEVIVKAVSIVVCIALFGSTYWARKNIGRVDKIAAAKSEYTSSLHCIEERYNRNIKYLKEANALEKKINSGTYTGDIKEARSSIARDRERSVELVLSSNDCIEEAEEYEEKHNIEVPLDKVKIREKIRNAK